MLHRLKQRALKRLCCAQWGLLISWGARCGCGLSISLLFRIFDNFSEEHTAERPALSAHPLKEEGVRVGRSPMFLCLFLQVPDPSFPTCRRARRHPALKRRLSYAANAPSCTNTTSIPANFCKSKQNNVNHHNDDKAVLRRVCRAPTQNVYTEKLLLEEQTPLKQNKNKTPVKGKRLPSPNTARHIPPTLFAKKANIATAKLFCIQHRHSLTSFSRDESKCGGTAEGVGGETLLTEHIHISLFAVVISFLFPHKICKKKSKNAGYLIFNKQFCSEAFLQRAFLDTLVFVCVHLRCLCW